MGRPSVSVCWKLRLMIRAPHHCGRGGAGRAGGRPNSLGPAGFKRGRAHRAYLGHRLAGLIIHDLPQHLRAAGAGRGREGRASARWLAFRRPGAPPPGAPRCGGRAAGPASSWAGSGARRGGAGGSQRLGRAGAGAALRMGVGASLVRAGRAQGVFGEAVLHACYGQAGAQHGPLLLIRAPCCNLQTTCCELD